MNVKLYDGIRLSRLLNVCLWISEKTQEIDVNHNIPMKTNSVRRFHIQYTIWCRISNESAKQIPMAQAVWTVETTAKHIFKIVVYRMRHTFLLVLWIRVFISTSSDFLTKFSKFWCQNPNQISYFIFHWILYVVKINVLSFTKETSSWRGGRQVQQVVLNRYISLNQTKWNRQ